MYKNKLSYKPGITLSLPSVASKKCTLTLFSIIGTLPVRYPGTGYTHDWYIFNGMGFVYNFLLFIFKCLLRSRSCLVFRSREDSKEEHSHQMQCSNP